MRPEIREVLYPIYGDVLIDHDSVSAREDIQGMGGINVFWHCHNQYESSTADSPSKRNVFEAGMIAGFVNYLIHNGIAPEKITILTFYTGQQAEIFIHLRGYDSLKRHLRTIKIVTVDSYQGEQNDIVILSLVRSNSEQKIGFLENENRVCVALSRAERGFYVFGDIALLSRQSVIWWEIGKIFNTSPSRVGYKLPITCQRHNTRTMIEDYAEWNDIDGGCRLPCGETREDCGHKCILKCHPLSHDKYPCAESCLEKIPICGHTCTERCGQACRCGHCGHWANPPEEEGEKDEEEEQTKAKEVVNQNLGFGGIRKPVEKVRRKKTGKYANAARG
jgi:helicase required for RNAi-mediated heterochromatin assembly 1